MKNNGNKDRAQVSKELGILEDPTEQNLSISGHHFENHQKSQQNERKLCNSSHSVLELVRVQLLRTCFVDRKRDGNCYPIVVFFALVVRCCLGFVFIYVIILSTTGYPIIYPERILS